MFQPAHLDSFLRLFVSHMGATITQGEMLMEAQSSEHRMDMLLYAIEQVDCNKAHEEKLERRHDNALLFVEQMRQMRLWADMLGQFDRQVERIIDDFLVATLFIDKFVPRRDEELVNQLNIDAVLCAIFELLGRLEEQYDMMEVMFEEEQQIVNGVAFSSQSMEKKSAQIIPLYSDGDIVKRPGH